MDYRERKHTRQNEVKPKNGINTCDDWGVNLNLRLWVGKIRPPVTYNHVKRSNFSLEIDATLPAINIAMARQALGNTTLAQQPTSSLSILLHEATKLKHGTRRHKKIKIGEDACRKTSGRKLAGAPQHVSQPSGSSNSIGKQVLLVLVLVVFPK